MVHNLRMLQEHKRRAALAVSSSPLIALRSQSALLLCPEMQALAVNNDRTYLNLHEKEQAWKKKILK